MNTHKQSILSKSHSFWLQAKHILFGNHSHATPYNNGRSNHLAVTAYNFKPRTHTGFQWQVQNPTLPEKEKNTRKWRKHWDSFITPEITTYDYSPTGGLTNITVSISNKTSQMVDYVQVKVLYMKKDGSVYKSEYAELFDVAANSIQKVPVYSSPTGDALRVYITNVVADAFGLAYSKDSYE